ncbi:hypothetical protein KM043_002894 [Ampulex compressa]|nr:hypothetical protein KM043_002894 [Ampulex compressa]
MLAGRGRAAPPVEGARKRRGRVGRLKEEVDTVQFVTPAGNPPKTLLNYKGVSPVGEMDGAGDLEIRWRRITRGSQGGGATLVCLIIAIDRPGHSIRYFSTLVIRGYWMKFYTDSNVVCRCLILHPSEIA